MRTATITLTTTGENPAPCEDLEEGIFYQSFAENGLPEGVFRALQGEVVLISGVVTKGNAIDRVGTYLNASRT